MLDISFIVVVHMLAGSAVVLSGAMALLLRKGSSQHKFTGRLFVGSMVLMGPIVVAGAWFSPGSVSSLGLLFVFFIIYLVGSAWITISRTEPGIGLLDKLSPAVALCVSAAGLMMGFDAVSNASDKQALQPNEAYFFFSALAFVAMVLDINHLRSGGVRGKHRIVRHVWRMSCGLFFATSSLFTGPGSVVFPESVRANPLLSIPQVLVIIISIFWIYNLLFLKQKALPS